MILSTKKFTRERMSLRMLKHSAPVLSPLAQAQIKQQVLLSIQSQPAVSLALFAPSSMRFRLAKLTVASAFGLLAIFSTAFASSISNPGDILYPVKRVQETVRLNLAPSEETKAQLQAEFAQERINEFKKISKAKTSGGSPKVISNSNANVKKAAKKEVKNALHNLQATETNLKKQGKIDASLSIQNKINNIKLEAKEQNLIEESVED